MSSPGDRWRIGRIDGGVGAFHAADPPAERSATVVGVEHPTLVVGSSQDERDVDGRVAAALGVEVVRRRSGGGAVLLMPGEFAWIDLVVPAGDPLWSDDVGHSMRWVGEAWRAALASLGVGGVVHGGAMEHGRWSRAVCFAGRGTGEVFAEAAPGGKLVGISQRRTRQWARFQTMCHVRWRPELVSALVRAPRPTPAEMAPLAQVVPCDAGDLADAVVAHLPG